MPPEPAEIFRRSELEGRTRLERSALGQLSTGFTAGFNIVFAIVALGIAHAHVAAEFSLGKLAARSRSGSD